MLVFYGIYTITVTGYLPSQVYNPDPGWIGKGGLDGYRNFPNCNPGNG